MSAKDVHVKSYTRDGEKVREHWRSHPDCSFLSSLICTARQIILVKLACVGVFGSEKLSVPKKSNWKTGLFLDCTDRLRFVYYQ